MKELPKVRRCYYCRHDTGVLYGHDTTWHVSCQSGECGAVGPARKTKRGAINAWNKPTKQEYELHKMTESMILARAQLYSSVSLVGDYVKSIDALKAMCKHILDQ